MANTYTDIIPKILARGLEYLRANSLMPRLANRDYDGAAAERGQTINVPVPPTIATNDVTAAATQPSNVDTTWATTPVALSFHREAPFFLTDAERMSIMEGADAMAANAAIAALCEYIDGTIMTAMDVGASIATGTAGTDPFATSALAMGPLAYLDTHKLPRDRRHVVMTPQANLNLMTLEPFTSLQFTGDVATMTQGSWAGNARAGAQWWMSQNCPTHTAGTGASYLVNNGSGLAVGATTIAADTGSGTILAGDVVVFAGDAVNKYVVATALSAGSFTIAAPGLKVAIADNAAITVSATHRANFAFQRDAVVFASRPFAKSQANVAMDQVTDPITGLTLRLEITRQHRQDKLSFDAMWGTKVVRSAGVIKVMGGTL